jgi:hypothetical protein
MRMLWAINGYDWKEPLRTMSPLKNLHALGLTVSSTEEYATGSWRMHLGLIQPLLHGECARVRVWVVWGWYMGGIWVVYGWCMGWLGIYRVVHGCVPYERTYMSDQKLGNGCGGGGGGDRHVQGWSTR